MKKGLLLLLLSFFAGIGYAQSDSSKLSPSGIIYYSRPGFFRPAKFTVNGKQETFKEINIRLANAKASVGEFKQYEKYKNLTWFAGGGAIASLIASAVIPNHQNKLNTPSTILLGVSFGFIISEFIFGGKRNRHYGKAFQLYNQQFQSQTHTNSK